MTDLKMPSTRALMSRWISWCCTVLAISLVYGAPTAPIESAEYVEKDGSRWEFQSNGNVVVYAPQSGGQFGLLNGSWRQDGDRLILESRGSATAGVMAGETLTFAERPLIGPLTKKSIKYRELPEPTPVPEAPKADGAPAAEAPAPDDKSYQAQVEAELKEAQRQWEREERQKEDDFERIHQEKIEEWRTRLRAGEASYDDHPDVLMMKRLTGQSGTLIAPSVAREYDQMLIDRGWYPLPLSDSQMYSAIVEGRLPKIDRNAFEREGPHPDVPAGIKLPAYNAVREHFLKGAAK